MAIRLRLHTSYILIHCSATKATMDISIDDIERWHTDPPPKGRGWSRVGYHYFIKRSGVVQSGLAPDFVGIHARGYNSNSLAICLEGGLDENGDPEDNFTEAQFRSLSSVLSLAKRLYPEAKIMGHRDISPDLNKNGIIEESEWLKACPCFDVKKELGPSGRLSKA